MSNPDDETMRECWRCRALNSFAAIVCGLCGTTLGKKSDTFEIFGDMCRKAIARLERVGLDDEGRALLHEANELATYFANPTPNGAERNATIARAVKLYERAREYRSSAFPPTRGE
jgi:hypothetical protein